MFTMTRVQHLHLVKRNGIVVFRSTSRAAAMSYRDAMNAMRKDGLL